MKGKKIKEGRRKHVNTRNTKTEKGTISVLAIAVVTKSSK